METCVTHLTPTAEELQPFYEIKCQQTKCGATFTNMGNYMLHMQRRHQILREKTLKEILYYCPDLDCMYNFKKGFNGRHFKQLKNLRQHFQKVHGKNFMCERCGRSFHTPGQLSKHVDKICGQLFECFTCNWKFKTKEAMLVHGKRKGHVIKQIIESKNNKKVQYSRKSEIIDTHKPVFTEISAKLDEEKSIKILSRAGIKFNSIETQTEQFQSLLHSLYHDTETQTETLNSVTLTNASTSMLDDMNIIYHDIETQTELTLQNPFANSKPKSTFFEQILAQTPAAHMHTQTSGADLFSSLGLSDIQTQTNWPLLEDQKHMNTTTSTSTSTGFSYDELLVSTETQTSFTQCLLESTDAIRIENTAGTNDVGTSEESTITFAHLYNTQYTQTSDLPLGSLFGGQESDLINGFQSTYTQT